MTLFYFLAQVLDFLFEAWPLWVVGGAVYCFFKWIEDEKQGDWLDWGWVFVILIGAIFAGRGIIYLGMGKREFLLFATEPQYTYWCFFLGGFLVLAVMCWKIVTYLAKT